MTHQIQLLRNKEVISRLNISKSTLYRLIQDGRFPLPINIGYRSVAFPESEVNRITDAMIKGEDLKQTTTELIAKRNDLEVVK